jgi:hypothetical protein
LTFIDMFWVLGACNMLQHWSLAYAIWHVTYPLALITWEVMGAKHDKVKKTQGRRDWGKQIAAVLL